MMTHRGEAMRTTINLSKEQRGALARFCEAQRIPRAEAVRRAVDHFLREYQPEDKEV